MTGERDEKPTPFVKEPIGGISLSLGPNLKSDLGSLAVKRGRIPVQWGHHKIRSEGGPLLCKVPSWVTRHVSRYLNSSPVTESTYCWEEFKPMLLTQKQTTERVVFCVCMDRRESPVGKHTQVALKEGGQFTNRTESGIANSQQSMSDISRKNSVLNLWI